MVECPPLEAGRLFFIGIGGACMIALFRPILRARARAAASFACRAIVLLTLLHQPAAAINIFVDYTYDTNNFFNTPERRASIEAAARRYSEIITTSLLPVTLANDGTDPRVAFTHPGTGEYYQISPATSTGNDAVVAGGGVHASLYRGPWTIDGDQWILYVGGRPLASGVASEGGTRTGLNFPQVFESGASHLNRGFRPSGTFGVANLPVWGGSVTFDTDGTLWHSNHTTPPAANEYDLYSFALHEIGHALGLNDDDWVEWTSHVTAGTRRYRGQALSTYNADNGAALSFMNIATVTNAHWTDNVYDSYLFQNASPNLVGSIGLLSLQDLLMEKTPEPGCRLELTNVDVAALRDLGWTTVSQFATQPGDINRNGKVDAADLVAISKGITNATYAIWKANFGESLAPAIVVDSTTAPEPIAVLLLLSAAWPVYLSQSRTRP
jgi:hypothetical protein